jgi:hypothetical protein
MENNTKWHEQIVQSETKLVSSVNNIEEKGNEI